MSKRIFLFVFFLLVAPGFGESSEIEKFNRSTRTSHRAGADWTKSPLQVALRLVGDRHGSRERNISIESTPETFRDAKIVITEDGYLDDSVRGARYQLKLTRTDDGYWVVERFKKEVRCWPGRGHQDYSDKPCH